MCVYVCKCLITVIKAVCGVTSSVQQMRSPHYLSNIGVHTHTHTHIVGVERGERENCVWSAGVVELKLAGQWP